MLSKPPLQYDALNPQKTNTCSSSTACKATRGRPAPTSAPPSTLPTDCDNTTATSSAARNTQRHTDRGASSRTRKDSARGATHCASNGPGNERHENNARQKSTPKNDACEHYRNYSPTNDGGEDGQPATRDASTHDETSQTFIKPYIHTSPWSSSEHRISTEDFS